MWADVSWGRFWGWDPRRPGPSSRCLIYMIVLHLRHVGWASHFNLAFGSALGFLFILFTWYVVNYMCRAGSTPTAGPVGGQWAVYLVFGVNAVFLAAATARYLIETSGQAAPPGRCNRGYRWAARIACLSGPRAPTRSVGRRQETSKGPLVPSAPR